MNVFWNETAFPLCSATDSCWNRKVDSLTSPVMLVVRLPISRTSSTAWWCQVRWSAPCFDDHRKEHVGVKQLVVLRVLVGCCVGGCWSCLSGWVSHMCILLLLLLLRYRHRELSCSQNDKMTEWQVIRSFGRSAAERPNDLMTITFLCQLWRSNTRWLWWKWN